jgi:hypothetical protein
MLLKSLIVFIVSLFVSGCCTTKSPDLNVANKEVVYIKVPESLLKPCSPDAPMATETYMGLTLDERELALSKYVISLYGTIAVCDNQVRQIKKYTKGASP